MNHDTTEPFNQEPDDFSDAAIERARRALDETPEMIGPYRIIERLGAGGMGEVYRADQKEPIRRQVAIKLIKLGMESRQVVACFEAERQALAMMDHPNIAKLFLTLARRRRQAVFCNGVRKRCAANRVLR